MRVLPRLRGEQAGELLILSEWVDDAALQTHYATPACPALPRRRLAAFGPAQRRGRPSGQRDDPRDRSGSPGSRPPRLASPSDDSRDTHTALVESRGRRTLARVVGIVLADSAVVTLALPDILREFDAEGPRSRGCSSRFNLALAVAAVPAARLCPCGATPGCWALPGLVAFAVACGRVCACAVTRSAAGRACGPGDRRRRGRRRLPGAAGGCHGLGDARGAARWAGAGVAGAALGTGRRRAAYAGDLMAVDLHRAAPVGAGRAAGSWALRGRAGRDHDPALPADRPHVAANVALALISAALTAALFLLVLLLVEGWRRSPAEAALIVTVIPVAALAAGPLARAVRAGTRSEAVAGAVAVAGGLAALALLPGASAVWTLAPQALVGLGLGLTVDSLTAVALRDRVPRALHGGWTIAARHAGIVAGLVILTPVFTADLRDAREPAQEAIAAQVLDSRLPASSKLALAEGLGDQLSAEGGRVPDLAPAFARAELPAAQATRAAALERGLDDQLERAATGAFGRAFFVGRAAGTAGVVPALFLGREAAAGVTARALALPLAALVLAAALIGV